MNCYYLDLSGTVVPTPGHPTPGVPLPDHPTPGVPLPDHPTPDVPLPGHEVHIIIELCLYFEERTWDFS